jgi:hypothetical protein
MISPREGRGAAVGSGGVFKEAAWAKRNRRKNCGGYLMNAIPREASLVPIGQVGGRIVVDDHRIVRRQLLAAIRMEILGGERRRDYFEHALADVHRHAGNALDEEALAEGDRVAFGLDHAVLGIEQLGRRESDVGDPAAELVIKGIADRHGDVGADGDRGRSHQKGQSDKSFHEFKLTRKV